MFFARAYSLPVDSGLRPEPKDILTEKLVV
jgi:hypothetical protein